MSYLPPNQLTASQFAGLLAFVGREPGNLVWIVRSGQDGIGLALFHVYAPDMDTARERAAENMSQISEVHKLYAERGLFTVHANDPSDVTLKSGPYDEIPAIDFHNAPVSDWSEFFPERPAETGRFAVVHPDPKPRTGRQVVVTQRIDVVPEGTEVVGLDLSTVETDPLDTIPHPWYCQCRESCAEPDAEVR